MSTKYVSSDDHGKATITRPVLAAAISGVVRMLRNEWGPDQSLAEVAELHGRWEGLTQEQVDAMLPFERWLAAEGLSRLADDPAQVLDVVLR